MIFLGYVTNTSSERAALARFLTASPETTGGLMEPVLFRQDGNRAVEDASLRNQNTAKNSMLLRYAQYGDIRKAVIEYPRQ